MLYEQRWQDGSYFSISFDIYRGLKPFLILNDKITILNKIWCFTGSQWRCISMGVMCAYLNVFDNRHADEFCIDFNLEIRVSGKQNIESYSNLDVMLWRNVSKFLLLLSLNIYLIPVADVIGSMISYTFH